MCAIQLTTQEKNLLMDVWQYQTSSVTKRYERLSFSSCLGNKLQDSLLRSGLISSSVVILPRGRIKILTLTDRGKKVLGIDTHESDRQGGSQHRYWVKRIAGHLEASGYKVAEEVPIGGGQTIDIVAMRDGKQIAFEIETGNSDAVANMKKCLDAELDKVVVVATSTKIHDRLFATLPRDKRMKLLAIRGLLREKND